MPKKKPEGRRGRGDGTLVERSPGVWRLRVFVGLDPVTKRPRQASRTFRGTRTDALKALRTFAREVDAGEHKGTKATVSDLFKAWLVHLERVGRRPATLNSYRIVIKTHLEPIRARRLVRSLRWPSGWGLAARPPLRPRLAAHLPQHRR